MRRGRIMKEACIFFLSSRLALIPLPGHVTLQQWMSLFLSLLVILLFCSWVRFTS
jgi:hypothetical protein